jgi:hypothetical protein
MVDHVEELRLCVTITVDTFGTTKCGAYEISAAVLP